jgi:hypothetical protein
MDNLNRLKQIADENMKMAESQLNSLNSAMRLAQNAIANCGLEPGKIINAQRDIDSIKEKLSKGDSSGISELLNKYADKNNKQ